MEEFIDSLQPHHLGYLRLKQALLKYQNIKKSGCWNQVPAGKKLRKGDYGTRIAALRSRLIISGDLTDTTIGNQDYFVYKLRQDPANSNALGRIKFIFPNEFSIYLHDTPTRNLFNKTRRTFSSGCIRIEKPVELATYLLQNNSK